MFTTQKLISMNFWAARNAKSEILDFSGPTCKSQSYFIQCFVCKCSFREISIIKMIILDQSKPILLIFNNKKSKICKLHVYCL